MLLRHASSDGVRGAAVAAITECMRDSDAIKDGVLAAGTIPVIVEILARALRNRRSSSSSLRVYTNEDEPIYNCVQSIKSILSGGGNAVARKAAMAAARGLATLEEVLAAYKHADATDRLAELVSNAEHARVMLTSPTICVGTSTVAVSNGPCSNPGCVRDYTSRCSKCATPYCSAGCQRAHWPTHKKECKSLASAASVEQVGGELRGNIKLLIHLHFRRRRRPGFAYWLVLQVLRLLFADLQNRPCHGST